MRIQLQSYEYNVARSFSSMIALTIEMDIKSMIRHLHLVLVATLNKWANILVAAAENHISPFAISAQNKSSPGARRHVPGGKKQHI